MDTTFRRCCICDRVVVCDENLRLLRNILIGLCATFGTVGIFALPLVGFGFGGVAAGSLAASWQASIGSVTAGSLFAILQSLGATGMGSILFGTFGAAMPYLIIIAVRHLNWCEDEEHAKICKENEERNDPDSKMLAGCAQIGSKLDQIPTPKP